MKEKMLNKFKVGDLVKASLRHQAHGDPGWQEQYNVGIVVGANINMWGEEVHPSGVKVWWQGLAGAETVFHDEIELLERD